MSSASALTDRKVISKRSRGPLPEILEVPNLISVQLESFRWFQEQGLRELLEEVSPIRDFTGTRLELHFLDYQFLEPKHTIEQCREQDLTYAAPLRFRMLLKGREKPEPVEQWVFIGDFPLMTPQGTFIVNGAERVVVSQLIRSPGVYFSLEEDPSSGREFAKAKLIPDRGGWLELEISAQDVVYIKLDGKRKIPVTAILQALGYSPEELLELFRDTGDLEHYIQSTLSWADNEYSKIFKEEEGITTPEKALGYIYTKLRPGDPLNLDNARMVINNLFRNPRRYSLGHVGRYRLNRRLGFYRSLTQDIVAGLMGIELPEDLAFLRNEFERDSRRNSDEVMGHLRLFREKLPEIPLDPKFKEDLLDLIDRTVARLEEKGLTSEDIVEIIRRLILVNARSEPTDDIDHLGNRRVRTVGELLQSQFRIGLFRLERAVKERMSILNPKQATPASLVNIRLLQAAIREFFGTSQLSQFMDQTNPLAELTHKRRLSAMGPGGLSRERAGFEVRDVHPSHYGRICPIETPEGPNIGLIGSLATYARVNSLGFLETPYRRVIHELDNRDRELIGRTLRETVRDSNGEVIAEAGTVVTEEVFERLGRLPRRKIPVVPYVSDRIQYLTADKEEEFNIAQATAPINERGEFTVSQVEVRRGNFYYMESPEKIDFMDISPKQIVSVTTSLIPFLEHDDANRALMGSNMQRQAVPLIRPQAPIVGTGMERVAARDSGQIVFARRSGVVTSVTSRSIVVRSDDGEIDEYPLMKFVSSNQGTCITQRPVVNKGDRVRAGQLLADTSTSDRGELALGQNLLAAFLSWEGYNFEDAVIVSEDLVRDDRFTSIHIERYDIEARETKLGPEEITRDIPNVGEESLRDLDEQGVVRIGAEVGPGDILVGKITYKGETELTAEEKLLRAIFGEKARDVKDTSLRVPHGEGGRVIQVKVFSREQYPDLGPGVLKAIRVWVAQRRKVTVGDKLAGRHGNKGVISKIVPREDMPFLPDGRPVEIILNPIGVPSRMNLGQILETHLGAAAYIMGWKVLCPVFQGADARSIEDALGQSWLAQRCGAVKWEGDRPVVDVELAKEWVSAKGYDGEKVFSPEPEGEARRACLRIWLEDQGIDPRRLSEEEVQEWVERLYKEHKLCPPILGKVVLRDGRTGEPFDQPVTVGYIYMMKLVHLVEDKIHARSTGPYSLITQQPLGGKAQFGGQRFGEMEVWALEAYGAAHTLQEMLTVKSDDITGRSRTYEALIKGEDIIQPGVPESFKVLSQELKSLGLAVEILGESDERLGFEEEY